MKKKCPRCKRKFSTHLIQPLFMDGKYFPLCPLCALELVNTLHGLPLGTSFRGEMANASYEEALKERKNEKRKK